MRSNPIEWNMAPECDQMKREYPDQDIMVPGPILLNERWPQNVSAWRGNYQIMRLWYCSMRLWISSFAHPECKERLLDWNYSIRNYSSMFFVAKGSSISVVDCFPQNIFPTLVHLIRSQYTLDQDMCCIFHTLAPRFYLDYNYTRAWSMFNFNT